MNNHEIALSMLRIMEVRKHSTGGVYYSKAEDPMNYNMFIELMYYTRTKILNHTLVHDLPHEGRYGVYVYNVSPNELCDVLFSFIRNITSK